MKQPTRCRITCAEPGCTNPIHYFDTDLEVPLYCCRHRKATGRHAAVRKLQHNAPEIVHIPEKTVILRCSSRACRNRITITMQQFRSGDVPTCGKCGRKMVYHKEGDDHV